jgi:tetratricopeptide (TPR) repeat protein
MADLEVRPTLQGWLTMDCRTLFASALGVLILGSAGCFGRNTTPPTPPSVPPSVKTAERPKKNAKAQTWIAYGNFHQRTAEHPETAPAQKQILREEARAAYQKALQIDPESREAHAALAQLHASQGDHNRAMELYRKLIDKHPKDGAVWYEVGMYHNRKKDWNQALISLHKAIELEPDNQEYIKKYGFTLARAGRPDDAVVCLGRVMHKADAHYNVARMLQHMKQPELCKQHLQIALQTNPGLAGAQQMLAQLDAGPGIAQIRFDTGAQPKQ